MLLLAHIWCNITQPDQSFAWSMGVVAHAHYKSVKQACIHGVRMLRSNCVNDLAENLYNSNWVLKTHLKRLALISVLASPKLPKRSVAPGVHIAITINTACASMKCYMGSAECTQNCLTAATCNTAHRSLPWILHMHL